jgi:hypothetical protein
VAPRLTKDKVWEYSEKRLRTLAQRRDTKGSVRVFDGNVGLPDNPDDDTRRLLDLAKTFAGKERQPLDKVPSLPDCWLWVSREALVGNRKAQIDIARARRRLLEAIPDICADPETTLNEIREGRIRMVTVSKARYNPRFRGRLMVDGGAARKLLTHIGLCLCQSERIGDLKTPFLASQHRGDDAESADLPA